MQSKIKNQKPKIILASASPRRAQLLRAANIPFTIIISKTKEPERKPAVIPAELWPICLAYLKATAVARQLRTQNPKLRTPIILAADTIVIDNSCRPPRILNKAPSRAAAKKMLTSLLHKTHRVITGIALLQRQPDGSSRLRLASASATCRLRPVSAQWLEDYLESGLWKGKAGAYGIQDHADPFVELLEGDFSTVVGLPMPLLLRELASFAKD